MRRIRTIFLASAAGLALASAAHAQSAGSNSVWLDQLDSGQQFSATQSGANNRVGSSAATRFRQSAGSVIGATGNTATITQGGTGNILGWQNNDGQDLPANRTSSFQAGSNNQATATQNGNNGRANLGQTGTDNTATLTQGANVNGALMFLSQNGSNNSANLGQGAGGATGTGITGAGGSLVVTTVTQTGTWNAAITNQNGTGNAYITIGQSNSNGANASQVNTATATQTGATNESSIGISQFNGNSNTATATQTGGANSSAIQQWGTGNTATTTQTAAASNALANAITINQGRTLTADVVGTQNGVDGRRSFSAGDDSFALSTSSQFTGFQSGAQNTIQATQMGLQQVAFFTQTGVNNWIFSRQANSGNQATTTQTGNANTSNQTQIGVNGFASIDQNSNTNLLNMTQDVGSTLARLTAQQYGGGQNVIASYQGAGNDNRAEVYQGTLGGTAIANLTDLRQSGNGNRLTVNQNR